jgi:tetratricopeptide (TPR) repeat protein
LTNPAALYEAAAACYERSGYRARAAHCLEAAGLSAAAARTFEQAGELTDAARCYRRAGQLADAERSYLALGLPEQAAAGWEEAGDLLRAAFVLAVRSRNIAQARWLATEAAVHAPRGPAGGREAELHRMQSTAIVALCDARASGDSAPLARVLGALEDRLPSLPPDERWQCETFSVTVGDAVGRHDLAARALAASHRAGTPGATARWRAWAAHTLHGTIGVPSPADSAPATPSAPPGHE